MRVPRENKMRFLILLQVLILTVNICHAEDKPKAALVPSEEHTEMAAEFARKPNSSTASELFDSLGDVEGDGNNLDFDYDDGEDSLKMSGSPDAKEQEMQEVLLKAMKKPAIRKQIGEVIPILRVMSPAQRLTLAAMVSSQIMSQNTLSEENLTEIAAMFASKNLENKDDRHNITEHLLLPISMDIAKMFKGLVHAAYWNDGQCYQSVIVIKNSEPRCDHITRRALYKGKEMGRNLRENFYGPHHARRLTRKPNPGHQATANRRMDEVTYEESEEKSATNGSATDMLRPPGKDECDFFTKNLCLEVANYPTEAIILSLKKNQDIAKTFLTDFEVQPTEEPFQNPRGHGNSRRLERRQDGQNDVQDPPPDGGYMCPSSVKYARPKRARTTSGQWKYIVNAGDYTQTLRLEICQKPKSPCSYVTNHLTSECAQIYNYHRLLTWDEGKGLHMDIFKVPSCCSCHIQGYSSFFPPNQDFTFAEKRREPAKGAYPAVELPNRPPFGYVGNKREVAKHVPPGSTNDQNKPLLLGNAKEFFRNPADHLVPPGPPLPLENEGVGNPYLEPKYSQRLGLDPGQRNPVQAEYRRIIHKVPEGPDSLKELSFPSNNRLKPQIPPPERVNLKFSKTHHLDVPHRMPQETNPLFDPSKQMHPLKTAQNPPPTLPHLRNPGPGLHPDPKLNSKPPSPYFNHGFPDSKPLPSKINPSYVTPPRVSIATRLPTTPTPPQKPDLAGPTHKKVNYNYHPIIDFFLSETNPKKRHSTYTAPQYLPLSSQDWTPVVGH